MKTPLHSCVALSEVQGNRNDGSSAALADEKPGMGKPGLVRQACEKKAENVPCRGICHFEAEIKIHTRSPNPASRDAALSSSKGIPIPLSSECPSSALLGDASRTVNLYRGRCVFGVLHLLQLLKRLFACIIALSRASR